MTAPGIDPNTTALEFISRACSYTLFATLALLAWVASGVDFTNGSIRLAAIVCLTLSVIAGVGTLALVPLVQEARKPGQSNFEVDARFVLFGRRRARLKSALLPQYVLLLVGVILYVVGMLD